MRRLSFVDMTKMHLIEFSALVLPLHRECIQPYFFRHLKDEVFRGDDGSNTSKLSKKNEIIVWLKLSSFQRQVYEGILKSEIVQSAFGGSCLVALTILKKICDHPLLLTKRAADDVSEGTDLDLNQIDHSVIEKIAETADIYKDEKHDVLSCKISFIASLLDKLIPEGHNVLIFAQTRRMLNFIQEMINTRGYKFLRIDGTTTDARRSKSINNFQDGVGATIFLLTSQVGGFGLTLTKADRVILVDPAWNPRRSKCRPCISYRTREGCPCIPHNDLWYSGCYYYCSSIEGMKVYAFIIMLAVCTLGLGPGCIFTLSSIAKWECSSYGRALALHARGTGFDSPHFYIFLLCDYVCPLLNRSLQPIKDDSQDV
ncbi:SNF2-related, N-terminal domain-containing protein [Tanacetum coccineum]